MLKFSDLEKKNDVFTISRKEKTLKNSNKIWKIKFYTLLILILFFGMNICSIGQELIRKQGTNGKWGFVDETGLEVIPFKYDMVKDFDLKMTGIAEVKFQGKWGIITKDDKVIIPFHYNFLYFDAKHNYIEVSWGERYGIIDIANNIIVPIIYYYHKLGKHTGKAIQEIKSKLANGEYKLIYAKIQQANTQYITQVQESIENEKKLAQEKAISEEKAKSFKFFADNYIKMKISNWQKQGEFEIE